MIEENLEALARKAAELIIAAKKLVVFTGAGISTESGIPDFRSPGGIWSRFDPEDFTYQKFTTDIEARRKQWRMLGEGHLTTNAQPNPAHYAIAELGRLGKLDCVITQNVDNLHHKAGVPVEKVFELHGNVQWAICLDCGRRYPFEHIKARWEAGAAVLEEASRRSSQSDLFIVVGSTLIVYPAAYMPIYAVRAGAKLIIVNLSDTPMDDDADVLIRAKAGEAMSRIVEKLKEKLEPK